MNDTLTFELKRQDAPILDHPYESFFGAITSTSVPSWHKSSSVTAKVLGSLLLGTAISPGATIDLQEKLAVHIEDSLREVAPITVPQKIESIREAFGLSTSALADVLGVSRPTVYQWIKGQSEPTGENRNRLDQVALHAANWHKAFPGESMDHWLTDSEPGKPSLLELLRQESQETGAIRQLMVIRMRQAREANQRIEAARKASGMGELPAPEGLVPEEIYRWSETRQSMLRNSNLLC